jgi:hypothetical protein
MLSPQMVYAIRISCGPHIATFRTVINRFEHIHYTREKRLPTQSTTRRRLTDPRVDPASLPQQPMEQWGKAKLLLTSDY